MFLHTVIVCKVDAIELTPWHDPTHYYNSRKTAFANETVHVQSDNKK